MKKQLIAFLFVFCLVFGLCACNNAENIIDGKGATGLPVPTSVRIEDGYVVWNPVDHATKYTISIDGDEYFCNENKYPSSSIRDGEHIIKVKANGDGMIYATSPFSDEFKVILVEGSVASSGYYSQFDELTMQESFLGYGFDVINSSVFYDKTVKTSSPIFKTDELLNLRLLKVDSKHSSVEEVQSRDMNSFMSEWNANLNVNVNFDGLFVGGSVGVNAAYTGGSETAKDKYFHVMTFNNQKFYIVMQGTTNQYRNMLSEGFEQDLYSDMSPADLFNKYGTHFITSAVMGGKINSYYLYTSEEETNFHDVSAAVSVSVRYWTGSTNVGISGGYRQLAQDQNIYIKNSLEVIGGGDFPMLSDTDIAAMYGDWQKSLEDHPSLIGIKDSGSLWPVWDLIDPEKDTRSDYTWIDSNGKEHTGSRAEQLQGYFMKYGIENYNILAKNAGIPEIKQPTSIGSILVNGKESSNGEYEVFAGTENRITFAVYPEDAIGYNKNIRLSAPNSYVTIGDDNTSLIIDSTIPDNYVFEVVISAGSIKQSITVRVIRTYSVEFITNLDDVEVEDPIKYRGLRSGRQISEPKLINQPYGYVLVGWYKDPYFTTKYAFGSDPVLDNITLYAKWELQKVKINFVTNKADYDISPIIVTFGKTYCPEKAPCYEGYVFEGYYTNSALTEKFDLTTPIYSELTLYLKWNVETYTITFLADNSVVSTQTYSVENKNINLPAVPQKDGFLGCWESFTLTSGNITVNAIYNIEETLDGESVVYNFKDKVSPDLSDEFEGNTLLVSNTISKITLIGNPDVVYNDFSIILVDFIQNQELTICFENFNFKSNAPIAISTSRPDKPVNLTIDVSGICSITSTANSGRIIGTVNITGPISFNHSIKNITFTGAGTMTLTAGDGADSTSVGIVGQSGGTCIVANNLIVDMSGSLIINGGDGGDGFDGEKGYQGANGDSLWNTDGKPGGPGSDGSNGGNGGASIHVISMTLISGDCTLIGGNGGNGGNGGDGGNGGHRWWDAAWGGSGGSGGNGGNGGTAGNVAIIKDHSFITCSEGNVTIESGLSGNGGLGGEKGINGAGSGGNVHGEGYDGIPGTTPIIDVQTVFLP